LIADETRLAFLRGAHMGVATREVERKMSGSQTGARRGRGRPPSQARRQQLLDLAAAMFAREGYHGTSMRALAERAGLNQASLYYYFASKEEALLEICLTGIREAGNRLEQLLDQPGNMAHRLRAMITANIVDVERHGDYRHVYYEQRDHLRTDQKTILETESRRVLRLLNRLFAQAKEAGELHPAMDVRQASLATAGTLQTMTRYYVGGALHDYSHVAEGMSEALIRGLSAAQPR